eukprot:6463326-Prymnesium_polylepis.1
MIADTGTTNCRTAETTESFRTAGRIKQVPRACLVMVLRGDFARGGRFSREQNVSTHVMGSTPQGYHVGT